MGFGKRRERALHYWSSRRERFTTFKATMPRSWPTHSLGTVNSVCKRTEFTTAAARCSGRKASALVFAVLGTFSRKSPDVPANDFDQQTTHKEIMNKSKILYLFTRTPLHVGAGASVGALAQPIQRER